MQPQPNQLNEQTEAIGTLHSHQHGPKFEGDGSISSDEGEANSEDEVKNLTYLCSQRSICHPGHAALYQLSNLNLSIPQLLQHLPLLHPLQAPSSGGTYDSHCE